MDDFRRSVCDMPGKLPVTPIGAFPNARPSPAGFRFGSHAIIMDYRKKHLAPHRACRIEWTEMLHLNHAIMHVIDFDSCVNTYSQEEMDINAKWPKGYCAKHAKKALGSIENMRGSFAPESAFAEELRAYFKGERDFVDLSCQIAEFIAGELTRMEKPVSTDVLVIDFEDDPKPPSPAMTEEEIERAYQAKGSRYFALFLLESKPVYMHEAGTGDTGGTAVSIKRHFAILPNPSQKIASYALIERGSMDVLFVDKPRTIAGEERMLIPDGLLQCSKEASSKEVIDTVTRIVEEVAQEYGANPTVAMSKAKARVSEAADEDECIAPWEIGEEVFEDEPLQKRYEQAIAEAQVPERVPVKKEAVKRVAKNHKIRTDTGIEITFPAEYFENPDFIEFVSNPDGMISIELKNIGSIENR